MTAYRIVQEHGVAILKMMSVVYVVEMIHHVLTVRVLLMVMQ